MNIKSLAFTICICLFGALNTVGQTNTYPMGTITLDSTGLEIDTSMTSISVLYSDIRESEKQIPDLTNNVDGITVKLFSITPKGMIRVKFSQLPSTGNANLELWNASGNLVKTIVATKKMNVVYMQALPTGTYTLKAIIGNNEYTWDIVKE